MIKIESLSFKYEEKTIFDNVNLNIQNNLLTAILGPNGAGKSTLLELITGNIKTKSIITNDFKKTFYLPQNPYCPKGVTTFDYLSGIKFKNKWRWYLNSKEKVEITESLELTGLTDKKNITVNNLSGGEFQKANIALGLLSGADLFLLDEPASNMDLVNQIKILKLLRELTQKNISCALISHDLSLISNFANSFIGISHDHKIIQKEKDEFFTKDNLKKIYNIDFEIMNNDKKIYIQPSI